MKQEHHGQPGHLNVFVLDQESEVTSFGKHNRLVVGREVDSGEIVVREDIKHGLSMSTEEDRQRVAKGYQRMHPKGTSLKLIAMSGPYPSGDHSHKCIEYRYVICRNGTPIHPGKYVEVQTALHGKLTLRAIDMPRMPSHTPGDWLKFQKQHILGTELSQEDQDAIQAFMLRNRTEVLTNGIITVTLAGGMLAHCEPTALH